MTEVEQEVERRVATAMRKHNLQQAHGLLGEAKRLMRQARDLVEPDDPIIAGEVTAVVVNKVEGLMWKIETAIRESK